MSDLANRVIECLRLDANFEKSEHDIQSSEQLVCNRM